MLLQVERRDNDCPWQGGSNSRTAIRLLNDVVDRTITGQGGRAGERFVPNRTRQPPCHQLIASMVAVSSSAWSGTELFSTLPIGIFSVRDRPIGERQASAWQVWLSYGIDQPARWPRRQGQPAIAGTSTSWAIPTTVARSPATAAT